ncbi:MAG: hypothetical protein AABY32_04045 [Nanoarchaeota archaeon]
MKVKELIDILSKQDPNRLVVMSKDGGGNSYSPFKFLQNKENMK